MKSLNTRQSKILAFIREKGSANNQEIKAYLEEKNKLLKYIDTENYFSQGPDERSGVLNSFNFDVFDKLDKIFKPEELEELEELHRLNESYQARIKKLPKSVIKKEFERLTIELSWKSSQIEGNTYSLIDTEILIKENKEASGHGKEEAIMILNHKKTLDYISDTRSEFKTLTLAKITNIHKLIISNLGVEHGLRKTAVGITGTTYRPLDNEHQIREAIEKMIVVINKQKDIFTKTLLVIVITSYIQAFVDGNKRTARLLGNALLLAHNACPLSYRSVDESDYKKAMILFYEKNNIRMFKELFIDQFKFAINNYFLLNR